MKMKAPKKCARCGEEFIPWNSRQRFCSKKIMTKCVICGDEFETVCSDGFRYTCSKPECKKQSNHVSAPREVVCKNCGDTFVTIKPGQVYCNQEKQKECPSCGKVFTYVCGGYIPTVCGDTHCQAKFIKDKRTSNIADEIRVCKWCGKEFHPKEVRDAYCEGPHYKICVICGKEFEVDVRRDRSVNTCSKECKYKYAAQQHDFIKGAETNRQHMREKYGVDNAFQLPGFQEKAKQTSLKKYGVEWYVHTQEYKDKVKETCLEKYGVEHHLQSQGVIDKRVETLMNKYGVDNISKLPSSYEKAKQTWMNKYGVEHVTHVKEIKDKMTRSAKNSKLELRISAILANYNIEFIHHYFLRKDNLSHEFDFYIPRYKLLIDADGLYFHSYLDDPDGMRVREDYDEIRLMLVPEDHIFHIIVENEEDRQIKELMTLLESIDGDISKYDSELFKWCRSIKFPYPEYTEKRMLLDWEYLKKYENPVYVPQCRKGQSILKNFHKSIYHCHVGKSLSPYEGWNKDDKLKQVIRNRLIYKNDVDPSKILAGFNISKICPCVSTFNPVLARYLTLKYLAEFNCVFDPFSGFSGRLIGVASTGRKYIGQDINETTVKEANQVIQFLKLNNNDYSVIHKDMLESSGEFECMLTCPPYSDKEIYGSETVFKSCDEWIEECLKRFRCQKYVFVVDTTDIFTDCITEDLVVNSHINKVVEKVVVIERGSN